MAKKNGNNGNSDTALATYTAGSEMAVGKIGSGEELDALLAGGEILPAIVSLAEEGDYLEGIVVGPGQVVDYNDPSGDPRPLNTWRIAMQGGVKVDLIGAHQLNKTLPELVGHRVVIIKGAVKKVGAKQVNQYLISDKGAQ